MGHLIQPEDHVGAWQIFWHKENLPGLKTAFRKCSHSQSHYTAENQQGGTGELGNSGRFTKLCANECHFPPPLVKAGMKSIFLQKILFFQKITVR